MNDTEKLELNRKEDHFAKATLTISDGEIKNVPCKIYLPERTHEKVYVIFKPSMDDMPKITHSHKCALQATSYLFGGNEVDAIFEASEVYLLKSYTNYWGTDSAEATIIGEPLDLHIVRHFKNTGSQEKTNISFWISPNERLTPPMGCISSYTGEIKYDRDPLRFEIKDQINLAFDKYFNHKTAPNGDLVQWSRLVANTEQNISADCINGIKTIRDDLDDFLLLASFAARRRTVCLGWEASDSQSVATYYNKSYAFSDVNIKEHYFSGVVDYHFFREFIEKCYPTYLQFENKEAISHAIYAAVPFLDQTTEMSFLHKFAGLEALILDFRKRNNLVYVLSNNATDEKSDWAVFRKYLKTCIENSGNPKLELNQKTSLKRKLGELNRASLSEGFDAFCKEHDIYLDDLWPVFGNNGLGLASIRNRLAHGDPIPRDIFKAIAIAELHLKFTLERSIMRVLGWEIGKSLVGPEALSRYHPSLKDVATEQERLAKYLGNDN